MTSLMSLLALGISAAIYFGIAWRIHRRTARLSDHFPLNVEGGEARVSSAPEFSAATVATTLSLATVILAYTELASFLGAWLYWTVLTTGLGLLAVRFAARRIWARLSLNQYRGTIHEFLGAAYQSRGIVRAAAMCTSLGFMSAFAVELTVGATFLHALVPRLPALGALVLLATLGVGYTILGGFRAVILTDRIQMRVIWLSVIALAIAVLREVNSGGGMAATMARMPQSMYDFSNREGLLSFLVGILVINVPTYIADMSVWQRIAAAKDAETVDTGLVRSIVGAVMSWTAFATLACMLVVLVTVVPGENALITFLRGLGTPPADAFSAVLLFAAVFGLYAASLSTASTQLIAAGQALHMDVIRRWHDKSTLAASAKEVVLARGLLFFVAFVSVAAVWMLHAIGFSIADLVFAVYGAQLGLVPAVLVALRLSTERLARVGSFAMTAVLAGFAAGWGSAAYGKLSGISDLVFLAPAVSLITSALILCLGLLVTHAASNRRARVG
jgi:Na+/proline symporter